MKLGVLITHKTDIGLDFIIAANNLIDAENISVIFIADGILALGLYTALKGFDINNIYAEKKIFRDFQRRRLVTAVLQPILLSQKEIAHHVAHCQRIFSF